MKSGLLTLPSKLGRRGCLLVARRRKWFIMPTRLPLEALPHAIPVVGTYYESKKRNVSSPFYLPRLKVMIVFAELRFFHGQQHIDNLKESFNYKAPNSLPRRATSPVSTRPNRCHPKAGHHPQSYGPITKELSDTGWSDCNWLSSRNGSKRSWRRGSGYCVSSEGVNQSLTMTILRPSGPRLHLQTDPHASMISRNRLISSICSSVGPCISWTVL